MPNKVDKGGGFVCLKSFCVRHNHSLFAASVGRSKGKSDIGWFDMIKAHRLVNGKAVYSGVYVVRG